MTLIMRKAPLSWKTILVMGSITSTKALYTKVVDYEDDLLDAWRRKSTTSTAITVENLILTLKRLGWEQPKSQVNCSNQERFPQDRCVLLTTAGEIENELAENLASDQQEETHDEMLREVYKSCRSINPLLLQAGTCFHVTTMSPQRWENFLLPPVKRVAATITGIKNVQIGKYLKHVQLHLRKAVICPKRMWRRGIRCTRQLSAYCSHNA